MSDPLDQLLSFAQRVAQFPQDANAASNLVLRMKLVQDGNACRELARRFALEPAVAALAWKRLGELATTAEGMLEAATGLYAQGADEMALPLVDGALELDEKYLEAWELKGMLCRDAGERRMVYEKILELDPGNRGAVEHLIMLGRPRE